MQEESLRRLHSLDTTVNDNTHAIKSFTDSMEFLGKQVEDVTLHVDSLQTQVETLEKENATLHDKWITMEAHQRRNNLRVAGIPERTGENIKNIVIDIFGQISPDIAEQLHFSVEKVHWLGPRSADRHFNRRVIVQFISCTHRDKIWRDARTPKLLKDRKIQIFEDLTQDTKDARNKLWPLVEQARKERKKDGFQGFYALIAVYDMKSNDT